MIDFDPFSEEDIVEEPKPQEEQSATPEPVNFEPVDTHEFDPFEAIEQEQRRAAMALDGDSQRAAESRELSARFQVSRTAADIKHDDFKKQAEKDDAQSMLGDTPFLASWLAQNPHDAPIFKNDLGVIKEVEEGFRKVGHLIEVDPYQKTKWDETHGDYLGIYETEGMEDPENSTGNAELDHDIFMRRRPEIIAPVYRSAKAGIEAGYLQGEKGVLYHRAMMGEVDMDESFKRKSQELDEAIQKATGTYGDDFAYSAAQILGTMGSAFKNSGQGATVGAALGTMGAMATASAGTGPFAGLTFAGLASLSLATGLTDSTLKIEGGLAYADMIKANTDPVKARRIAMGVGAVNSMVEMLGLHYLGEAAKPILKAGISRRVGKTAEALEDPSFVRALGQVGKAYSVGVGQEVVTEVMQEGVNIAGEEIARMWADGQQDPATVDAVVDRLFDIAIQTTKGAAVLGLAGLSAGATIQAKRIMHAQDTQLFFEKLNDAIPKMNAKNLSPDAVHEYIAAQASESGNTTTYIDAGEFHQAMIDTGVTVDELRQVLPEVADKLEQAALNGADIEISTADYATKLAGTKLGGQLTQSVRLSPDALSARDAIKVQQAFEAMRKELVKGTFDSKAAGDRFVANITNKKYREKQADLERRYVEDLKALTVEKGNFNEQEAHIQARLASGMIVNLAQRANIPVERIDAIAPKLVSRGGGEVFNQNLSSRYPTAVRKTEDADTQMLFADYEAAKRDPEFMKKNTALLKGIPGMATKKRKPEIIAEEFIEKAKANLLFLFDLVPEEIRARAKLWYDGGRRMSEEWAKRYGIAPQTSAAVIAVLSPQKGWFENVSMGERILDAVFTKRAFVWDEAMTKKANVIANKPDLKNTRARAEGKTLGELLDNGDYAAAAIWIRCYDQTYNDSGYKILSPEGGVQDYARTESGAKANLRWQNYNAIAKAISCIEDPRLANISLQLGGKHKVRNFFNNLAHPESADFATIDTHAVAAATLIPLAASDAIVDQNFGGKGTKKSAASGLSGTYPYFFEAYRRAAAERGVLPREMQSITWEAIRAIYTDRFKKDGNKSAIVDIWKAVDKGTMTVEEARSKVVEMAGGLKKFAWEEKDYDESVGDTYDRVNVGSQIDVGTGAVNFEVAPDPNNVELTARWNALSKSEKDRISAKVAKEMVQKVLDEFEAEGTLTEQIGGYLGKTNPSFVLEITKGPLAMPIAKMLGYVLNQDSMMVTVSKQEVGTGETGSVYIKLPDGYSYSQIEALYSKLWELKSAKGESLCGGFSAKGNTMTILNFTGYDDTWLADKIRTVVADFEVSTETLNVGFPDRKQGDYNYEGDSRANILRDQATQILYRELDIAEKQGISELDSEPTRTDDAGNLGAQQSSSGGIGGAHSQSGSALAGSGSGAQDGRGTRSEGRVLGTTESDKFSLKQGELEHLYTFHNISEDNLSKAIELGGFPVPSLGIGKQVASVTDFGEITLIGTKDMIDPAKSVPVYSADAYTNRFPEVDWSKSVNKPVAKALSSEVAKWEKEFSDNDHSLYSVFYSPDKEKFISQFEKSDLTKQAFLATKGIRIEPVMNEPKSLSPVMSAMREKLVDIVDNNEREEWYPKVTQLYADVVEAIGDEASKFDKKRAAKIRAGGKLEQNYLDMLINRVYAFEPDAQPSVDRGATSDKIANEISKRADEYQAWVNEKTKDVFGEPKIKVGNKLVPVTLENVVKAMTKRSSKNTEETFTFSSGKIRAAASKKFKSIEAIQKDRGLITDSKTANELNKTIDEKFGEFRKAVLSSYSGSDTFAALDDAMRSLADASKSKPTVERLKGALDANGFDVSAIPDDAIAKGVEALNELKKGITDYFEAKPQRAVHLNEFAGAIVPTGTDQSVVQALESSGVAVSVYDPKVEGDRQSKLTGLTNDLQASRGDVLYQKQGEESRGTFSAKKNTISLTPNADLSTFAHEMSHWYLDMLFKLAGEEGVSETILEDVNTLLKEFGVESLEAWRAMSVDDQRKHHETFAAWTETYLAEGKAPTQKLERLLARFADWLKAVYKQFRDPRDEIAANYKHQFGTELPPISDEVRRVLDRMIASDEALEQAQSAHSLKPLFDQKPDDMNDDDWKEMMLARDEAEQRGAEAINKARAKDERWYHRARSKKLAEIQKKGEELKKALREKISRKINGLPGVVALDLLKKGGSLGVETMKLDPDALWVLGFSEKKIATLRSLGVLKKGTLGKQIAKMRKQGMSDVKIREALKIQAEQQISASRELLRPFARFNSNEKMIEAIVTAGDRDQMIEDEVTRQAMAQHSEWFDEKKREEIVTKALHNEARARLVATELKYLMNDREGNSRIYREAARMVAAEMVAKMPMKSVNWKNFVAAESRASRKAYECIKKGDRMGAVLAKRQQLVQHEAVAIAMGVEKKAAALKATKKLVFGADKKVSKSMDIDIIGVVRYILTNNGYGRVAPSENDPTVADKHIKHLGSLDDVRKAFFQGYIDKYQYRGGKVAAGDLTVEAFEALADDVEQLVGLAKEAKKMRVKGKRENLENVINELLEQTEKVDRKRFMPGRESQVRPNEKATFSVLWWETQLLRVETWCRLMDGGQEGPFTKYIYRPAAEAAAKYRVENSKLQKKLVELIRERQESWAKQGSIDAHEIGYEFKTKQELIGALLHTGNQSNLEKLLLGGRGKGKRWAELVELPNGAKVMLTDRWDAFIARCYQEGIITKEDMDFCQAVWDLLESTKPAAQKAFKDLYGYNFVEVEATQITTPFGVYCGGYVPAITTKFLVAEASTHQEIERITSNDYITMMPVTTPGFSKTRSRDYTEPLLFDISLLCGHVSKVLKFSYIAPAVYEVGKVITDRQFARVLFELNPHFVDAMLKPWLKRAYTQSVSTGESNWLDQKLNKLRSIAGMNIMAGHLLNALQQWTGLTVAMAKVSPKSIAKAAALISSGNVTIKDIIAKSSTIGSRLADRAIEYESEIARIASGENDRVKNAEGKYDKLYAIYAKGQPARDWISQHGYFFQTVMQAPIDCIVWLAAYNEACARGLSDADAVAEADSVVRTTQSDFSPENIAGIEAGSALYRAFLVFYNYFGMQANLLAESWVTKDYGVFARDAMMIVYIPSIISAIIANMGFDFDDDDDVDAYDVLHLLIAEPFKNVMAMIPFLGSAAATGLQNAAASDVAVVGDIGRFLYGEDPYAGRLFSSPAIDLIASSYRGAGDLIDIIAGEEVDARRATRNILDLVTLVTGISMGAIKRPAGYLAGVAAGDYSAENPAEIAKGLVTGKGDE